MRKLFENWEELFILIGFALALGLMVLTAGGCRSSQAFSYYQSGQLATAAYSEGMVEWSDGAGKIMPLGNISVNGVGVGK